VSRLLDRFTASTVPAVLGRSDQSAGRVPWRRLFEKLMTQDLLTLLPLNALGRVPASTGEPAALSLRLRLTSAGL
jgi:hypothetical protein